MKNILKSLQYLRNYKGLVFINAVLTIIIAVLEIFSLVSFVPLLQMLFSKDQVIKPKPKPEAFQLFPLNESVDNFKAQIDYFSNNILLNYPKEQVLIGVCLLILLIFLIKNIFVYLDSIVDRYIRFNVTRDQRMNVYNKVIELPVFYFNNEKRGDVLTRYSSDIDAIRVAVLGGYKMLFKQPVKIITYIFSMLVISVKLTLFIFILIPILGLIVNRISKSLKKKTHLVQNKASNLLALLDETMFGAKIIKSFTAEEFVKDRFEYTNEDLTKTIKSVERRRVASSPISEILGVGIVMLVMWYGGSLILSENSNLTGTVFLLFVVLFARLIEPIKSFTNEYSSLVVGMASAERVEEFLAIESEFENENNTPIKFKHKIEFQNVEFKYPNTDQNVISNFNLSLLKGTTTALVGQSGAGKSTIADLLPRFYDVSKGAILLDGEDIKNYSKYQIRSLLSYVSQEAILFNDTVYNNISFGIDNVSEADVIAAAKAANAHEFITKLDNGYNTNVGERGGKLSGGQKQRVTIARAILKNAPILILDEATSALDTESEKLVQDAIERLLKNRTALVIAHRLSTIKDADQICVMQDGLIVEQGTHQELLEQAGTYRKLTEMQSI